MPFSRKWMELENIMQNEMIQTQKIKDQMFLSYVAVRTKDGIKRDRRQVSER